MKNEAKNTAYNRDYMQGDKPTVKRQIVANVVRNYKIGVKMTVNDFIEELQRLSDERKEKEIVVIAPNGMEFEPKLKIKLIDKYDVLNHCENNIESTVIFYR